ncbi:long-chain fatty acid--CoA ligase [Leptolyngbya sp. FACHB-36]|uniref:AMP-dependent synthetase/ligase n=1 Tax=Leptolyngbya sp. FACHB-36 TaxID=2692808 RepID=UPI00168072C4|nr:long-chain fatty acid--CoA ligase [Leptolyngbya sp. FACHB-36]MBD2022027.1 long-chain fatty acid--CoA ligase [Leptolyngbya sp. FACHB-36]
MTVQQPSAVRLSNYDAVQSIPEVWAIAAQRFGNVLAVHDPHSKPEVKLTYAELYQQMQQFAAGLQALGIQPSSDPIPPRVALFADNSPRWLIADQGVMQAGAADVVRSGQADAEELLFILGNSEAIALIVEDLATLNKLREGLPNLPLQFVVLLSDEAVSPDEMPKVLSFPQVMALGDRHSLQPAQHTRETLATLMYTSGTGGTPKGVMLSHGNLVSQVTACPEIVVPQAGERVLSILPIWHSYERSFEYFIFSNGCTQIYTNIRHVKKDLKDFQPHYMVGVPRLWESIYEGIQKQLRDQPASRQKLVKFFLETSHEYVLARRLFQKLDLERLTPSAVERLGALLRMIPRWIVHRLGDRIVYQKIRAGTGGSIKFVVSGGGSIAQHLEDFFEIVGVDILGGYGLTETSPITNVRRPWRNVRGADGETLRDTEIAIVDPETRQPLPPGKQGLVMIRGPQVMQGYFNNPEATAKAIDRDGWFNSGDLGMVTSANDLVITGRAKDTIVLTNGENIEPQPIEDACLRSPYIDQIMLVGQDQKVLGALIVPNVEALEKWSEEQQLPSLNLESKPVQDLIRNELNRLVKDRSSYRPDDRIGPFRLISEPFTIENGLLTQTLKIRRNVVMERYQGMISEMFV